LDLGKAVVGVARRARERRAPIIVRDMEDVRYPGDGVDEWEGGG
jgi:hypothetical protein